MTFNYKKKPALTTTVPKRQLLRKKKIENWKKTIKW